MSTAFRRVIRLQRQILKTIRADVRKAMGPQSRELKRYYEAYKREFRGPARHSTKEELLKACLKADIILLGDYHTFAQSQKAALRLLGELVGWAPKLTLALELVPAEHQAALDAFMRGKLSEAEFLKRIDYQSNWGFNWDHFRPLFTFARDHRLRVAALNSDNERLERRDEHAAELLTELARKAPVGHKIFALYGDLHLARGHIPAYLRAELKSAGLKKRVLTIFQNSETLYWKLAESRLAHTVDVLALSGDRFCIMNAAPWVKLQSYLEWVESGELLGSSDDTFDDSGGITLHDVAHERLRHLCEALGLELPAGVDFDVQTADDLSFLDTSPTLKELGRNELKSVKYHVLGNRTIFIPGSNLIYLPTPGVNAINEGVTLLLHSVLSRQSVLFREPREHFFGAVLTQTLAYFGSKVLNHKRKCNLEEDFRLLLERPLGRGALPAERLQRRVAKVVLSHCQAEREYARSRRYRAPISQRGAGRVPVFLETARRLGAMLGERLYASYIAGRYPAVKLERLFRQDFENAREARAAYLKLLAELGRAPLAHSSKLDLF